MNELNLKGITHQIKEIMSNARDLVAREVSDQLLKTYWQIGRIIVEHEQDGNIKAQYGTRLIIELAKQLTREIGRGFSRSNLQNMRSFYLEYPDPICQSLTGKLTWTHYCELLSVKDQDARSFYEKEAANSNWSV